MSWATVIVILGIIWGIIFMICFFAYLAVKVRSN